jgi:HAD domain in Swiss Army Knife RNA repair proteins
VRVIFLDVDGVLNSEAFLRVLDDRHRQLGHHEACECFRLERKIDRDAVARLNRLVSETGAKIVISSSWRKLLDPPELQRVLVEHGLVAEIIGETPDGDNDPEMRDAFGHIDRIFRGHEIDFWLRKHPEVDRFVILDDCSDMEMHKNRLVQTDCEVGLIDEDVDLAIRVMSWDGKTAPPLSWLRSSSRRAPRRRSARWRRRARRAVPRGGRAPLPRPGREGVT